MYKALLLVACLLLGSCGNVGVEHYAQAQPKLDLAAFFSRPVQAWGMFQKRSGEVVKRFHVRIDSRREASSVPGHWCRTALVAGAAQQGT